MQRINCSCQVLSAKQQHVLCLPSNVCMCLHTAKAHIGLEILARSYGLACIILSGPLALAKGYTALTQGLSHCHVNQTVGLAASLLHLHLQAVICNKKTLDLQTHGQ